MAGVVEGQEPSPDALAAVVRVVEQLRSDVDEHTVLLEGGRAFAERPDVDAAAPRAFGTWQEWVDEWLVPHVSRDPNRYRWCRRYADHPEVAMRLEALWHAWEASWPRPEQRLAWLRDGLDHQLAVITSEDGPLRACSAWEHEHSPDTPLGS
jgi:Domain of unknown function (DUF4913)